MARYVLSTESSLAPVVTMGTPSWPSSPQSQGANVITTLRNIYNSGDDGLCFGRVVDHLGNILTSVDFSMANGELIDSVSIGFTMPGNNITIYAQCGYNGTVTGQKGPVTIELYGEPEPPPDDLPIVTMGTPSWPGSPQPAGAYLPVTLRNIYNSGYPGSCFAGIRDSLGNILDSTTFQMDTGDLIDSITLHFTMPVTSITIYADVGYNETVTDTEGPVTIAVDEPTPDPPSLSMGTPSWPSSPQPEGANIVITLRNIYNSGGDGDCFGRVVDHLGNVLTGVDFSLASGELIDSVSMGFTMPAYDIMLYAECGYDGTVTDTEGPVTIEEETPEPPPDEPFTVIDDFTVPESLPEGSDVNVRVLLRNAGGASGYLTVTIIGNPYDPDSYTGVEAVRSPTQVAPGSSVWLDIYFRFHKMPAWDFNLTATNYDETSTISKTILLQVGIPKADLLTAIGPDSATAGETITLGMQVRNVGTVAGRIWTQILDGDTGGHVQSYNRNADPDEVFDWPTYSFTMPNKNWNLVYRVGHLEKSTIIEDERITKTILLVGVGIPTTTTLSVPDRAGVDEKFNISGLLYETETGVPIPNQPINHSYYDDPQFPKPLGSSTTGVDGDYLKEISIPESGVWTLKSDFPGTEGLQASRALVDSVVAATPLATALRIAGPIATALALVIYGRS